MEDKTSRKRMAVKLLLVPAIVVAAIAIILAWDQPAPEQVEAASGGPEMGLVVTNGSTGCPGGTPVDHVCVSSDASFTLAMQSVGIPGPGYILAATFIDWGIYDATASEDGAGPNTCGDTIDNGDSDEADRKDPDCVSENLTYNSQAKLAEIGWPDLADLSAVKGVLAPSTVFHAGLTGFEDPPTSTFIGNLVELSFTCSSIFSSTDILMIVEGDPLAGTSGSLYVEHGTVDQIRPKLTGLTVDCIGPTPTPTATPIPPTPTATPSPTPTDTPTPLPPPSERPDIQVTKADLADPVFSGASYTYRITIDSIGLQTAENVVVEDTLPPGSVFKSATSADATCNENAGVVTCQVTNDMEPDDIITIDIVVNAPIVVSDVLIDNTVTATSSSEPFANTGNNKDIEQTFILAPRSDVTLEKVGDPTFLDGGEDVTYTLSAKNISTNVAENVVIVDTLPTNGTFVSASNPECGAPSGGDVTCSLGTLGPGATATVDIVMTAPLVTRNEFLKNTAVVSADNELFFATGNNLAVENTAVVAPPPDLVITKTDSQDPVLRLGYYSYEITIDNQGLGDALNVVITDNLPFSTIVRASVFINYAEFISATGAPCVEVAEGVVECTLAELNVSQQVIITLNVRAPTLLDDENVVNSVTASSAEPDEDPAGNEDSETTFVRACFDVNGDLIVDSPNDILQVILHLGLFAGDPDYDVIYDFDGDGFIGLPNDLLPVIVNFAQDCSLLL